MIKLQAPVIARTLEGNRRGVVVARTVEQRPRYDVRFEDGTLLINVGAEYVTESWEAA